jgi:hypothetical protein
MVRFNLFDISRRRVFVILSTAFLFAALIWFLNNVLPYRGVWNHFYTEKEMGTLFCEATRMEKLVRQPINTLSNFIYWLAAFAIIRRGWKTLIIVFCLEAFCFTFFAPAYFSMPL